MGELGSKGGRPRQDKIATTVECFSFVVEVLCIIRVTRVRGEDRLVKGGISPERGGYPPKGRDIPERGEIPPPPQDACYDIEVALFV